MQATMNHGIEDQMALISQLYPNVTTQQEEIVSKPRWRRKKKKVGPREINGGNVPGEMKKRKLSLEQVHLLEKNFRDDHKLESGRKHQLASEIGLHPRQVAVWFQNRRARWKSKKLEEEYLSLKRTHDSTVVEKSRLQSEILKLEERVSEAEKEIRRLSELMVDWSADHGVVLSSPISMEGMFVGGFGVEAAAATSTSTAYEDTNINYINYSHGIDWLNPYI